MRNCLVIFLTVIFILLFPGFLCALNIGKTFTPEYLKNEIAKSGVVSRVSENFPEEYASVINEKGELNSAQLKSAVKKIPSSEISAALQDNIDRNLTALADPKTKELVFDMTTITKQIPAEFSEVSNEQIKDRYVVQIPLQVRAYRYIVNNFAQIVLFGAIFFAILLMLIVISAESWKSRFRSVSLLSMLCGVILFIPAFLISIIPNFGSIGNLPDYLNSIIIDVVHELKNSIAILTFKEAGVLLAVAILLFVVSFFFHSNLNAAAAVPSKVKP